MHGRWERGQLCTLSSGIAVGSLGIVIWVLLFHAGFQPVAIASFLVVIGELLLVIHLGVDSGLACVFIIVVINVVVLFVAVIAYV